MSRSVSTWIEVPQTLPGGDAPRPRRARSRAVRLTVATVPSPPAQRRPVADAVPVNDSMTVSTSTTSAFMLRSIMRSAASARSG
jgi:hypothetical protein